MHVTDKDKELITYCVILGFTYHLFELKNSSYWRLLKGNLKLLKLKKEMNYVIYSPGYSNICYSFEEAEKIFKELIDKSHE